MDGEMGLASAVAAMRSGDDGRYDGSLMLSALPGAPTSDPAPRFGRVREVVSGLAKRAQAHPGGPATPLGRDTAPTAGRCGPCHAPSIAPRAAGAA